VVIPKGESLVFQDSFNRAFRESQPDFRIQEYEPPQFIQEFIEAKYAPLRPERRAALHMVYPPLFIKHIFSDLRKILYLDIDIVALSDISELFHSLNFTKEQYFAAVPNPSAPFLHFSNLFTAWPEWRKIKVPFNSGVFCTDLSFWTTEAYRLLQYYLNWDKRYNYRLFQLDDEAILNLMFQNYIQLDRSWNCCGYGNSRLITWLLKRDLTQVKLLHWSGGHHKPWQTNKIPFHSIWEKYEGMHPTFAISIDT
jgi:lipopolysaccharide biosynthesis glycosyltransferase